MSGIMICNIKYRLITRWQPNYTSPVTHFKKLSGLVSEFSMGGVSTTNNLGIVSGMPKKVQRQILHMPGFWTGLSEYLRLRTTGKTKTLYGKT